GNLRHLGLTGEGALAIDMHHAGTAEPGAAAIFGSGELEPLAQNPKQRGMRRRVGRGRRAVDRELNCHLRPPSLSPAPFVIIGSMTLAAWRPALQSCQRGFPPLPP